MSINSSLKIKFIQKGIKACLKFWSVKIIIENGSNELLFAIGS